MQTCGVAVSTLLAQHGVEVVFGIPGNHTLELYRGLDHSPIRHITTRHEQGAAFMADGYARASGRPGVCFLISGPGLLNAATAIAQALADSVPMLIITAVAARDQMGQRLGTLHELPDQQAAARSFCRHALTLTRPEELPILLDYAFRCFASERPGPIHLQIPMDLMTAKLNLELFPNRSSASERSAAESGNADAIPETAITALHQAQEPVLLIGGGAKAAGAAAIAELAQALDAPVLQTTNAKGLIPRSHPLFVGGSPSLPCLQQALNRTDLLLAIGTEFGETDYDLLMGDPLARTGQLVRVDIDSMQLSRNQQADHGIVGNAADVIPALTRALSGRSSGTGAARAEQLRAQIKQEPHYHQEMVRFFETLQTVAPDLVLVGDSTRPTYYATWQFETDLPRHYFHSVSGFGTLGYAIPAALGASIASDHPVAALIGDGGAQFTLPELATAADSGVAATIVIWCNRGYEEIENSLQGRGVSNRSTDITAPDFKLIGAAYGLTVFAPRDWQALARDFRSALDEGKTNLLLVAQDDFLTAPSGQWYAQT